MSVKGRKSNERIGLRVTAYSDMGCRRYMEDCFSVAYQKSNDGKDLEFAYFGMFDGHGGDTAALFAKNHLMNFIVDQSGFWGENDDDVLHAIREGFRECHMAMWRDLDNWPLANSGLPSTAGTTASVAFIRKGKLYIGHCGDSGIVLAKEQSDCSWKAEPLTVDHKPDSDAEKQRIELCGGKVVEKQGIHRVVWYRPKYPHQGPIRRNTRIEEIPFLAVARSLGDLWSYNFKTEKFMVSPEPDVTVHEINTLTDKCLIFASDGLWNIMEGQKAVDLVHEAEAANEQNAKVGMKSWRNPSRYLVDIALQRWRDNRLRSDNTSVVCVMLDVPSKRNSSGVFGNMQQQQQEQNSRTIYDYSTSEAYNLDYMDINSYANEDVERQSYSLLTTNGYQQQQLQQSSTSITNPYQSFYTPSSPSNPLPSLTSKTEYQNYSRLSTTPNYESSSADLTFHTSSNESAFVKGCCPNERFMLAKANEQIHYHVSYEQHKEIYRSMTQRPLPPLHYAYRPVVSQPYMLPSMSESSSFGNFMPRPMERYNYLRPTEAEIEELHKAADEDELDLEQEFETDEGEMEWSDEEGDEGKLDIGINDSNDDAKAGRSSGTSSGNSSNTNEAETSGNDVTSEIMELRNSDDSIQIFEISSSNIGINGKSKNKEKANEKNKENSETHVPKRKTKGRSPAKFQGRYYETRQTNRKMRSGNVCGVQRTIVKEKQKKISRFVKKGIKAIGDLKTSTSIALKKLETLSLIKSTTSPSKSNKTANVSAFIVVVDNNNKNEKSSSSSSSLSTTRKVLRSSQISVKKAKMTVIRNLRSNAVLTEKTMQRKRNSKIK